jgi:hypothetical protein
MTGNMILIVPSHGQILEAQKKAKQLGTLNNSIRSGSGNVYGFLGEILMACHWKVDVQNTYDYDLIVKEHKVDVKTKACTSEPKAEYFCSVADYNTKQDCDVYAFVRILEDFSKAWLLGYCSKKYFYNNAKFYRKGDLDPSSNLGWRFRADCYNLQINALKSLKKREDIQQTQIE